MIPHKNNNGKHFGLGDRLAACIERVGGKRAMATAALISEAQLFRYINGETDIPSDKLLSIAKAADVDAGWLLTGDGDMLSGASLDARPPFRSQLMVQTAQLFEELLVEFEKSFKPSQRARAITFLYNALRHEETKRSTLYQPNKFDMLRSVNFLAELRTDEELDVMNEALSLLEYADNPSTFTLDQLELLRTWTNLLVRATKGYYSSYPGQVYFERKSGGPIDPTSVLELQNLIMRACKLSSKTTLDWLDLGCGSGRHLAHLAKHAPNLNLKGVELSQLGFNMCKELMDAEKLPKDCVIMGDMRQLPFASNSYDVVFANLSLYCLPYVAGTGLGLEEAMSEISRILRPNGIAQISFPKGNWRDYSMSFQYMDKASMAQLVEAYPMEILNFSVEDVSLANSATETPTTKSQMRLNHQQYLHTTIRKK